MLPVTLKGKDDVCVIVVDKTGHLLEIYREETVGIRKYSDTL